MKTFNIEQKIYNKKILILENFDKNLFKLSKIYHIILILENKNNRNLYANIKSKNQIHNLFFIKFNDLKIKIDIEHKSIQNTEKFFYSFLKDKNINIDILTKLYFNQNIENSIKKNLIYYYHTYEKIIYIYNNFKDENDINIKISNESLFFNNYTKILDSKKIIKPNSIKYFIFNRLYNLSKVYYLFFIVIFKMRFHKKEQQQKLNLINIYNTGYRLQNTKFDINADWIRIGKDNNEFLYITEDNLDDDFLKDIKEKKLNFYSMYDFKGITINFSLFKLFKFISTIYKFHLCFFRNYNILSTYIARSFIYLIKWEMVLEKYKPKLYFSYQNNNEFTYLRNIILSQVNCKTIFYEHTANNICYYVPNTPEYPMSILNIYNNNNMILAWNNNNLINYKKNQSEANSFLKTGPIWTNFFLDNKLLTNFYKLSNIDPTSKYIAFFPTSLSINSLNNEKSHIHFLKLIIDFIKNKKFSEYKILFKTKNGIEDYKNEMGSECKNLYMSLKNNHRFYHLESNISSIFICKISNLVINMAFSSTFHEALKISKRTFFYDYNYTFRLTPYYEFKNLVYSNNSKLIDASIKALNMNDSELNNFYKEFKNSNYYSDTLKLDYIKDKFYN